MSGLLFTNTYADRKLFVPRPLSFLTVVSPVKSQICVFPFTSKSRLDLLEFISMISGAFLALQVVSSVSMGLLNIDSASKSSVDENISSYFLFTYFVSIVCNSSIFPPFREFIASSGNTHDLTEFSVSYDSLVILRESFCIAWNFSLSYRYL